MSIAGSDAAAAGFAHGQSLGLGGSRRGLPFERAQFDAAQAQFVSGDDARAVAAADAAKQAVGARPRLRAADPTADCHLRRFNREFSVLRAASATREFECTGKERWLDARERADLDDDALDRLCTIIQRNFNDLRQKALADRQLVHGRNSTAEPPASYVRNRTDDAAMRVL